MTIKRNCTGLGVAGSTAGAIIGGVQNNFAATGTNQATAALLPFTSNIIVTTGTGGVILPPGNGTTDPLQGGDWIDVVNYSGATINVYPPLGGAISNGTVNAAVTVANGKSTEFKAIDGKNFFANASA